MYLNKNIYSIIILRLTMSTEMFKFEKDLKKITIEIVIKMYGETGDREWNRMPNGLRIELEMQKQE